MSRPAKVIIDSQALKHNLSIARKHCYGGNLVAVLKANAYGHGAPEVAKFLEQDVEMFAVSSIEEAIQLRESNIITPILLLEGCFRSEELHDCAQHNFSVVIHCRKQAQELLEMELASPLSVWLKIDTGMHRLGLMESDVEEVFEMLKYHQNVKNTPILMTHMASADLLSEPYTTLQLAQFDATIQHIQKTTQDDLETSIGNSGSILAWSDAKSDWSRPGIMLYGLSPFDQPHDAADSLIPVMSLQSEVIAVREIAEGERVGYGSTWQAKRPSVIATVAIGYGDGYPRNAQSGTPVLVNGQRGALAGRVSMDMLSVDVTDIDSVEIGDPVELWGQHLNANEVAKHAGTIGYELVTRMPIRVPKHYVTETSE